MNLVPSWVENGWLWGVFGLSLFTLFGMYQYRFDPTRTNLFATIGCGLALGFCLIGGIATMLISRQQLVLLWPTAMTLTLIGCVQAGFVLLFNKHMFRQPIKFPTTNPISILLYAVCIPSFIFLSLGIIGLGAYLGLGQ